MLPKLKKHVTPRRLNKGKVFQGRKGEIEPGTRDYVSKYEWPTGSRKGGPRIEYTPLEVEAMQLVDVGTFLNRRYAVACIRKMYLNRRDNGQIAIYY